jgi:hypothetical protein
MRFGNYGSYECRDFQRNASYWLVNFTLLIISERTHKWEGRLADREAGNLTRSSKKINVSFNRSVERTSEYITSTCARVFVL